MPNLPQQRDRLQPSEAFFNAFSLSLTDGISDVLRRASINRAPTGSLQVVVNGYVVKSDAFKDLIPAVRAASKKKRYVNARFAAGA